MLFTPSQVKYCFVAIVIAIGGVVAVLAERGDGVSFQYESNSGDSNQLLKKVVLPSIAENTTAEPSLSAAQQDLTLDEQYTKMVRPFIENFCLDCHTGDDAEGDFDLDKFEKPSDVTENLEAWSHVMARLERGDMPPADSCLLYTSPSPRDQRGSRMPSSA